MKKLIALICINLSLSAYCPSPTPTPSADSVLFSELASYSIANPYRGVQVAVGGSGLAKEDVTASGVPIGDSVYRRHWSDIESAANTLNSTTMVGIVDLLAKQTANNSSVNYRFTEFEPDSGYVCPTFVANAHGYYNTTNGVLTNQKVCNWANSNTRAEWGNMLRLFASYNTGLQSTLANWKTLGPLDQIGIGDFGENTYLGPPWTVTSKVTGSTVNGGQEIPPTITGSMTMPSTAIQQELLDLARTNYPDKPLTMAMGDIGSGGMVYALNTLEQGWRGDCWGMRNFPASCSGAGYSHCTLYPAELGQAANTLDGSSAFHYSLNGPVYQEICNSLTTWNSTPYDIAKSFDWAIQVGTSAINVKNAFATFAGMSGSAAFERQIGYRLVPYSITTGKTVTAGSYLSFDTKWYNRGGSKFYLPGYFIAFKFVKKVTGETFKYVTRDDIRSVLPTSNPKVYSHSLLMPTYATPGEYDMYLGVVYNNPALHPTDLRRPAIELAVARPADNSFWYKGGTVTINNAIVTPAPTTDYAAHFTAGSDQYLIWNDNGSVSFDLVTLAGAGKDATIAAMWKLDSLGASRAIVAKGNITLAASGNYALWYDNAASRLKWQVSNGTTIYAVSDANLGAPTTGKWYCSIAEVDNTAKTISITTNQLTASSTAYTGTVIDGAGNVRIGRDSSGIKMDGSIDKVRLWKRKLTSQEKLDMCSSLGSGLAYENMTRDQLEQNYASIELDEPSGTASYSDAFQNWAYTNTNGVTQTSTQ